MYPFLTAAAWLKSPNLKKKKSANGQGDLAI